MNGFAFGGVAFCEVTKVWRVGGCRPWGINDFVEDSGIPLGSGIVLEVLRRSKTEEGGYEFSYRIAQY